MMSLSSFTWTKWTHCAIKYEKSSILGTVGLNDDLGLRNELAKVTIKIIKYNVRRTDFDENLNILTDQNI